MSDEEWTWELSSMAEDDLDGLSPTDQDRILDKLDEIVSSPWRDPPDYGEPLSPPSTRLRWSHAFSTHVGGETVF